MGFSLVSHPAMEAVLNVGQGGQEEVRDVPTSEMSGSKPLETDDHTTTWFIPRIVSGLVHPSYVCGHCPHLSHENHQGCFTHLRFVGWATKYNLTQVWEYKREDLTTLTISHQSELMVYFNPQVLICAKKKYDSYTKNAEVLGCFHAFP